MCAFLSDIGGSLGIVLPGIGRDRHRTRRVRALLRAPFVSVAKHARDNPDNFRAPPSYAVAHFPITPVRSGRGGSAMATDRVTEMTKPVVDYLHLPGEEGNPLMESTDHAQWIVLLMHALGHHLRPFGTLVIGNVPFAPDDGLPHCAPDVMVLPGMLGRSFGRYEPRGSDPLPSACIEVRSPSNSRATIERRNSRLLHLGIAEVYALDPRRETMVRARFDESGAYVEDDAVGTVSAAMQVSFARIDGQLAICCPAGRLLTRGSDPLAWYEEEVRRADTEAARADSEAARADEAIERAAAERRRADVAVAKLRELGIDE
jgi:hypothetical protein